MKITPLVALLIVVNAILPGCASVETVVRSSSQNAYKLAKNDSSEVYGIYSSDDSGNQVDVVCKAIKDADPRCVDKDKYTVIVGIPAVGYFAGSAMIVALQSKNDPMLKNLSPKNMRTGDSNVTYAKFRANQGRFADVLEIASLNGSGEKKCYWSGMPRAGGTVCPAYDWDYRQDMRDYDTSNGNLKVSK